MPNPDRSSGHDRKVRIILRAALTLSLIAAFALPALATATTPAQHDAAVISFFRHHPRLAATRAGQREMWLVLAHLSTQLRSLQSARLQSTNDWVTAVRVVQRVYPGSQAWLLSCSASEGGHGGFVMNRQGSGAAGWAQFLPGTFWRMYGAAKADATSRGFRVPSSSAAITSALGQALAAAWGYTNGRRGEWMGGGC